MAATDIVRGVTSGNSGSAATTTTSITVTAPAGVATGDQLLVGITLRSPTAGAWNPPAGWILEGAPTESSGEGYFYRATYGTDVTGTSWTWDAGAGNTLGNKYAWTCIALKGVGPRIAGATQAEAGSATAAHASPSITTIGPANLVALFGDRSAGSSWSWPVGWIEQADSQSSGTNSTSVSVAVFDTTSTGAGTYSVTATASTSSAVAWSAIVAFDVVSTGPVTGTATFSASGALVAAAPTAPYPSGSTYPGATLYPGGSAGSITATGSAAFSGSGGLTTPSAAATGAASFSAAGSLSVAGALLLRGTASFSGAGALTAGRPSVAPVPAPSSVWPPDPYRAAIRSGGYGLTYTIDATYKGAAVATGMAPTGGTITDTTKPGVRRVLNLELAPEPGLYDKLAPIGTTLTVTAHVRYPNQQTQDIPMGIYDVDSEQLSEGGGGLSLTAPDKWVRIQRARFMGPATSTVGVLVTAQITSLIRGALGATEPVVVKATSTATMKALTWERDRDQTILDLAKSIGAWVFFDRVGVATIADIPIAKPSADWLVDASPNGVLISLDRQKTRTETRNVVVVSSSAAAGPAFQTLYVWDADPASPTYAAPGTGVSFTPPAPVAGSPFGLVPYYYDTPILTSVPQASAAGKAILSLTTGLASQVSVERAPNPAMDAFDSMDVLPPRARYDIARVIERHVADTITHPLTLAAMHIDGRSTRSDDYVGG